MVSDNTAPHGTAFTVSIDLKGHGVTTGIFGPRPGANDPSRRDASSSPADFARPGHVFPLPRPPRRRAGASRTDRAAVDLARSAGLYPAGRDLEIVTMTHHGSCS